MPSTYTTRTRLEKQAPGENNNTWGALLNANTIDQIDQAVAGMASYTLSGSKTLTSNNGASDEARCHYQNITGGTGGTVTIPNVEANYIVRNGSSGTVTFTTGSGTTADILSGALGIIVCEGGNVCRNLLASIISGNVTANGNLSCTGNVTLGDAATDAHTVNGTLATTNSCTIGANGSQLVLKDNVTSGINANVGLQWNDNAATRYGYFAKVAASNDLVLNAEIGNFLVQQAGTLAGYFSSAGFLPLTGTTASAANVFQTGSYTVLLRSTSSARYKKDVRAIKPTDAHRLLAVQPIQFRSRSEADDPNATFYGFIAEDVEAAGLTPLVHYAYQEDQVEMSPNGVPLPIEGEQPRADGVQYERVVVLQQLLINELYDRLGALEAKLG